MTDWLVQTDLSDTSYFELLNNIKSKLIHELRWTCNFGSCLDHASDIMVICALIYFLELGSGFCPL
jgi:hypothetical protein